MKKASFHFISILGLLTVALVSTTSAKGRQTELNGREGLVEEVPSGVRAVKTDHGYMVLYSVTIPGTKVAFDMVPIPGEEVVVERIIDGKPHKMTVKVEPRWVASREVAWEQYWPFMKLNDAFARIEHLRTLRRNVPEVKKLLESSNDFEPLIHALDAEVQHVDGVTAPTALYDPGTTYESGEEPGLPAVTMTPYAARQFTKWLSSIVGTDFRLPSEAEWEHAARAGTNTTYSFGDDPEELGEYAWFTDNADYVAHEPGEKQPNSWGLYDVHGNVAEWVLDAGHFEEVPTGNKTLSWSEAVAWPSKVSPRVAKGGYWDADASDCTIAARLLSDDEEWKLTDPNRPRSPWWYTDPPSTCVGIRLMRPLYKVPSELREKVWEIDAEELRFDVTSRLKEGRGKLGPIGPQLSEVLKQLDSEEIKRKLDGK